MDSMAMARGLLMLMPSPLLIPTTMVDTMDMVWATMVATVLDTMAWDTMARGLLMLMLIPTTMVDTLDMVWVTMAWDTMARGLLMLMPSPLLIPTTMVDTMDMV